jgi:hypothetical protein
MLPCWPQQLGQATLLQTATGAERTDAATQSLRAGVVPFYAAAVAYHKQTHALRCMCVLNHHSYCSTHIHAHTVS